MSSLLLILHDAQDCTPAGRERLKQELAKGFDLSESALNDIFADLPSILRRAEDRAEADSLKQIIEKIGGIVEIIEDTGLTLETIAELDIESSEQMVVDTASLPSEPDESVFETSDDLLAELEAQLAVQEETPLRDVPVNEISELAFELEFEAVQPAVTTTASDDETPNDRGKTRADPDNEPLFNFDVGVAEDSLDEMLQSDPLAQLHYDDELFDTNSQETQTESAVTEEAAPLLDLTLSSDPEYDVPEEEDEQEITTSSEEPSASQNPDQSILDRAFSKGAMPIELGTTPALPVPRKELLSAPADDVLQQESSPAVSDDRADIQIAEERPRGSRSKSLLAASGLCALVVLAGILWNPYFGLLRPQNELLFSFDRSQIQALLKHQQSILEGAMDAPVKNHASLPQHVERFSASGEYKGLSYELDFSLEDGAPVARRFEVLGEKPAALSYEEIASGVRERVWLRRIMLRNLRSEGEGLTPGGSFTLRGQARIYLSDSQGSGRVLAPIVFKGNLDASAELITGTWEISSPTSAEGAAMDVAENFARRIAGNEFTMHFYGTYALTRQQISAAVTPTDERVPLAD